LSAVVCITIANNPDNGRGGIFLLELYQWRCEQIDKKALDIEVGSGFGKGSVQVVVHFEVGVEPLAKGVDFGFHFIKH